MQFRWNSLLGVTHGSIATILQRPAIADGRWVISKLMMTLYVCQEVGTRDVLLQTIIIWRQAHQRFLLLTTPLLCTQQVERRTTYIYLHIAHGVDFEIIQRIVAQLKTFSTLQHETIPCDLLLLQLTKGIRVTDLHTHGVTT